MVPKTLLIQEIKARKEAKTLIGSHSWPQFLFFVSGFQQAWQFSPLLIHSPALHFQKKREEVFIVHGAGGPASLVLKPALSLWVTEKEGIRINKWIHRLFLFKNYSTHYSKSSLLVLSESYHTDHL